MTGSELSSEKGSEEKKDESRLRRVASRLGHGFGSLLPLGKSKRSGSRPPSPQVADYIDEDDRSSAAPNPQVASSAASSALYLPSQADSKGSRLRPPVLAPAGMSSLGGISRSSGAADDLDASQAPSNSNKEDKSWLKKLSHLILNRDDEEKLLLPRENDPLSAHRRYEAHVKSAEQEERLQNEDEPEDTHRKRSSLGHTRKSEDHGRGEEGMREVLEETEYDIRRK